MPDGSALAAILAAPRQWRLLRVAPNCEAKVAARCEALGIEAFYPKGSRMALGGRRLRTNTVLMVTRPVMAGYVFVSLVNGKEHFSIFQPDRNYRDRPAPMLDVVVGSPVYGPHVVKTPPVDGSLGFVSGPLGPKIVDRIIVLDLQLREQAGEFDEIVLAPGGRFYVPRWIKRGAVCDVVVGPFSEQRCEIRKIRNSNAVDVSMQGRWRGRVTLPIDYLRRIE